MRTHHLTVLNTWQVSSPHTFVQGDSRTQIDFLLTKVSSSGGSAKQAPLANFPLGSWKTGGHLPLFARIKPIRHWHLPGPRAQPLKHDSDALQQAVRQGLPIVTEMQKWVRDHVHQGMTPPEPRPPSTSSLSYLPLHRLIPLTPSWLDGCGEPSACPRSPARLKTRTWRH